MCGRYTLARGADELQERFSVEEFHETGLVPRFNVAPSQQVPIIVDESGRRVLQMAKWGLIPTWAKDLSKTKPMINARGETVAEKPTFKTALHKRRCIIPADGFFEWKHDENGRTPMYIKLNTNDIFGLAGLYEDWKDSDDNIVRTCAIITVGANKLMKDIHDRMPAILKPEDEYRWLNPDIKDTQELLSLLEPYAANDLEAYPVSSKINSPSQDDKECIDPVKR